MSAPIGLAEATEIAGAFLGEHWRERVERAGTTGELQTGFADVFLRGLRPQPERAIDVGQLRARLEERLGSDRVRARADGRVARVDLAGITASAAKTELDALAEVARELGSHARFIRVELDRAAGSLAVRVRCEVPLENILFFGEPPRGPRPPIERGTLVRDAARLRLDLVSCPLCKAEHAVFYNAKSHAQDRDDVPFACLSCSRHECMAWGIPELVSYRIDLVERLPAGLAREHRRDARRKRAWQSDGSSPFARFDGLLVAMWATVVVPAALLVLAWCSSEFDDPVFKGARTLATVACVLHGVGIGAHMRSGSPAPPTWLAFTFAGVLSLMIPVLVAMWG